MGCLVDVCTLCFSNLSLPTLIMSHRNVWIAYLPWHTNHIVHTPTKHTRHDYTFSSWHRQLSEQRVEMWRSRTGHEFELKSTQLPGLLRWGRGKETENLIRLVVWGGDNILTARGDLSMVLLVLQFPGRSAEYSSETTRAPPRTAPAPTALIWVLWVETHNALAIDKRVV